MAMTDSEVDDLIAAALKAHRDAWDTDDEDLSMIIALQDLSRSRPRSPDVNLPAADRAVDWGLRTLDSDDRIERVFAICLIREMHREDEVATALLDRLRREDDPAVIHWCISGLGFRGTPDALPDLERYAHHPDPDVRYSVAGAVSGCALPKMNDGALTTLLKLADDEVADVRFSALYELSSWWQHSGLRDPRAETRLRAGLDDPDEGVRFTCAEAFEPEQP